MKISIEEAYKILELEDHTDFQSKMMKHHIDGLHKEMNTSSDMYMKEAFLYMRQTGRTTYKCVDAAVRLLAGDDVLFLTHNHAASKRVREIIKNYIWEIGHRNKISYLDVGELKIGTGSTIEKLKDNTLAWPGYIIVDIY